MARNGYSPAAADSEFAVESAEAEYLGLIHVVQEAEDQSERRLAELALAIFLIGLDYESARRTSRTCSRSSRDRRS